METGPISVGSETFIIKDLKERPKIQSGEASEELILLLRRDVWQDSPQLNKASNLI